MCVFHTLFHRINLGLFGILPEYFTMLHEAFEKINRLVFVRTLGVLVSSEMLFGNVSISNLHYVEILKILQVKDEAWVLILWWFNS